MTYYQVCEMLIIIIQAAMLGIVLYFVRDRELGYFEVNFGAVISILAVLNLIVLVLVVMPPLW